MLSFIIYFLETAMGVSVEAQIFEDSDYVKNVKTMCKLSTERTNSLVKSNNYLYLLTPSYYLEKKTIKELHSFTNSVIDTRMNKLKDSIDTNEQHNDIISKGKLTFLDILIKSSVNGKPLSKEDIREEVDTFMFEVSSSYEYYDISLHN